MQVKDIKVNQLIEISLDEKGSELKNLASRVEEVNDEYLYVSIPSRKGQLLPFRAKQRLIVDFNYKGSSFQFETVIENRKLYPIPVLVIRKPESLNEIQRRHWVRVPAMLHLRYCHQCEDKFQPINTATSVDISGGGLSFTTSNPVETGQILDMEINLPDREPVFCKTQVLRLQEMNGKAARTKKVFAAYLDITETQRDRVVSFVLEKQRELIKKGLI